jgi:hypothetical protein
MSLQDERLDHVSMIMTESTEHYVYHHFTRESSGLAIDEHARLSHAD